MSTNTFLIGGRYRLETKLGAGAMGAVYQATDLLTGETVALKRVNITPARLSITLPDLPSVHDPTTVALQDNNLESSTSSENLQHEHTVAQPFDSQFATDPDTVAPNTPDAGILLQALAREFQTLASLRHPHIISVLNYGFDEESPYFTMNFLESPQTILEAGENAGTATQIKLLQQMLEALEYLHRRGILHHDLKPDNVLVSDGVVKVLDFGLAVTKGKDEPVGGTLLYMAPEVLQGKQLTEAADLYAVGIMAYQLFAGRHPFDQNNFLLNVLTETPELTLMDVSPALQKVVGKLLEKDAGNRYATAYEAIVALSEAVGEKPPVEDKAIRDSFLQAAKFVGRDEEMGKLLDTLEQSWAGKGSAWIIGGSSGVGKSRLVRELRTQALIKGTWVITGQAVREGALPYQVWREPLRRLVLTTPLTDMQAGVLKPLIPDLPQLLEQNVPDAPELDGEAAQQRLLSVMTALFRQQTHPILLLLEDLQWAGEESLALLRQLMRVMDKFPLMIAGSYRPEERPHLPDELPHAQLMLLKPLSTEAMIDLSVSMLGDAGKQPTILEFLQRETEGNAFFLVEVVRTLAEETGRLHEIGEMVLPETIFPDGIRTVVQRRLSKVPAWAYPLLQVAAVAGRIFDFKLLSLLAPNINLSEWVSTCAKMIVIEREEGKWQLSHDKLREGLLAEINEDKRIPLHQQVAEAMEQLYPNDPTRAAALTHHWHKAQRSDKERIYARLAGEHATTQFAHDEAIHYFTRALDLTPPNDTQTQYDLLLAREGIYDWRGKRDEQAHDLALLARLARNMDEDTQLHIQLREMNYALATSYFDLVVEQVQAIIDNTQAGQEKQLAHAYYLWGKAIGNQVSWQTARPQFEQAYQLAQEAGDEEEALQCLFELGNIERIAGSHEEAQKYFNNLVNMSKTNKRLLAEAQGLEGLGSVMLQTGSLDKAQEYYQQMLTICRQIGHSLLEVNALGQLAQIAQFGNKYDISQVHYEQALKICQETNHKTAQQMVLNNLGFVTWKLGNYELATQLYEQSLALAQQLGLQIMTSLSLINLGHITRDSQQYPISMKYYQQALALTETIQNEVFCTSYAYYGLGIVAHDLNNYQEATYYYQQSLALSQQGNNKPLSIENLVGLIHVNYLREKTSITSQFLEEVLTYLKENPAMHGAERPLRVHLLCYQILNTLDSEQANLILLDAYDLLMALAEKITEENAKQSFLQNVPEHRELMMFCQQVFDNKSS